jgi:hypothetical protein
MVQSIATEVVRGRQSLQNARGYGAQASNDLWTADSQLSIADGYVTQALFDTPQTDSSWLGRAADGPYRYAENQTDSASWTVPSARAASDDAAKTFKGAAGKLDALSKELSGLGEAWKNAASLATAAASAVGEAAGRAGDSTRNTDDAAWRTSDGTQQLRLGEMYLTQIELDRPGVSVSSSANIAESAIRNARWQVQDGSRSLQRADRAAGQSDESAARSQDALGQLLNELSALEQSQHGG